ncbi:acetolactate synthase small subunit [Flavobacterium sp. SH_e]|uniref:acetolactate synthase small subunit n=1 Tax=Flavobacterium sp. SH_e TaxID=2983767 RepID=UPI0021E49B49|nr:acetolactate synthase small subunit [Flavobacterium sp. SH_e]MCV2487523.1 acetolactate synthase small subunit [Flavobacterium sp. SH_e]
MKNEFTLTIYSEDQLKLINKLAAMFLRKQIKILSLNISDCEIDKMYRHTIVVNEALPDVINLTAQIEKIIEVYKCYYHLNEETVFRQMALFKIPTEIFMTDIRFEILLREKDLKISEVHREYTIIQAIGTEDEIAFLTEKLCSLGLIEFVKSSRISLIKSNKCFDADSLEMNAKNNSLAL